jgi:hypothetical protein
MSAAFINLPTGSDGRDEVGINVYEIAALRAHVVTSYSYVDYTEVTLKNGRTFDCRIKKSEVEQRMRAALAILDGAS